MIKKDLRKFISLLSVLVFLVSFLVPIGGSVKAGTDYNPVAEANKATTYSEMRAVLEHPATGNNLDEDLIVLSLPEFDFIDITSLNGVTYNDLSDASKDFIADILLLNKEEEDFSSEDELRNAFKDALTHMFPFLIPVESKDNGLTSILLQLLLEEFGLGPVDKLINDIQYKGMAQHFIDNQPYEYSDILNLTDSDSNDDDLFSKLILFYGQHISTVEPLANVTVNKGDSVTIDYSNVYPKGTLTATTENNTGITVSNNTGSTFDINGLTETTEALITITYNDSNDDVLFTGEMSVAVTDSGDEEVLFETSDNSDGTVSITKYNGTATDVEIPSEIDGKKVTAIGTEAFYNKGLTSVGIPDGVTTIGNKAFQNNELTNVEIPDGVTTIGDTAFAYNKLKYVVIPASVETIGSFAFYANRIEHVTFNSTPEIGQSTFGNQGFLLYTDEGLQTTWDGILVPDGGKVYAKRIPDAPTDVTVVAGVEEAIVSFTGPTHIGGNIVTGYTVKVYANGNEQTDLEKTGNSSPITVTGLTNATAYTFKVVATNAAGVGPESETTIAVTPKDEYEYYIDMMDGTVTITAYNGTEKEIVIPNQIKGKDVTAIGDNAFKDKGLTSVDLPNTITSIGKYAFSGNKLTKVEVKMVRNGDQIVIGADAFRDNRLTEVTLPSGVTNVGDNAFSHNELASLEIPGSLGTIGENAFSHNKLTSMTITPSMHAMGKGAFSYNELESVTFNLGVGKIADSAFSHNKLTSVTLPVSVSNIGNNAFASNQLERVTFNKAPEYALTIGTDAFKQDDEIVFPEFVGWYTDEELQEAWNGTSAPGGQKLFAKRTPSTPTKVSVVAGVGKATVSFTGPSHTDGNTVTGYTVKVYEGETELTELETTGTASPITVTGLTHGTNYTFKVTATNVAGNSAESVATNSVTPAAPAIFETTDNSDGTVTLTGYNGTATDVVIPNTLDDKEVTMIAHNVFKDKSLVSVTIPDTVISIGSNAFSNNRLTNLTLPNSLKTIGIKTFEGNQLASVEIPDGLTSIGSYAFNDNQLTSVTIPHTVTTIAEGAFNNNKIERVTFSGEPNIGFKAFGKPSDVFPEFEGWYTDESLETEWDDQTMVPKGNELYAKRTPSTPTKVSVVAGVGKATVSFTGPTHIGGNIVTSYTVKVYEGETELTELATTGTASPITVTRLQSGKTYTFKVIATNAAGNSVDSVSSASVKPTAPSNNSGGGVSPNPNPSSEIITVPVETGGSQQESNGPAVTIKRTTDANKNKKDEMELTLVNATETVQRLKEIDADMARIVIPDAKDEVAEVNVSINKDAVQAFKQGAINLEFYTENARIIVPKDSISKISDNLYFRVIPIKKEQEKDQVKERAKQEEVVRKVAGSLNINVVGRPMTIETNMPNQPVDLILPLKGVTIPTDAKEREAFFDKLGVFIEHSDGEKVFIKGEVVPYKNGESGLKFTINKFSTFTIIKMENGWKDTSYNNQFTGRTTELALPVMGDKVWTITFNQAANPETVNGNTVYVYDEDGEKVAIDVQLANRNRSIKISPKTHYKPDAKYYIYLSENMESSNGKKLGAPERYVFKTTSYSLGTDKIREETNVSPTKEWTVTLNTDFNEAMVKDNQLIITDQHGRKIDVMIEMINPKTVRIKPIKPYDYGQTYYLFTKDLATDINTAMKFTIDTNLN